jgi:hypothetical protein
MSNGKGSSPRPFSVPMDIYKNNWDSIFTKKDDSCAYSGLPSTQSYSDHKEEYLNILNSGMLFEWYPGLTGNWEEDKLRWGSVHR